MAVKRPDNPKGILNYAEFARQVKLNRYVPGPGVAEYVEYYWTVFWELPEGKCFVSENLPYPSCHLVFEPERAYLQGVVTNRFEHRATGTGLVFSVKFLPGMTYAFIGRSLAAFTDRRFDIGELFGRKGVDLAATIRATRNGDEQIKAVESFLELRLRTLRSVRPGVLSSCSRTRTIVDWIAAHPEVTAVSEIERAFAVGPRALQLLFNKYVGVAPKWVVRRYRMLEAVEALHGRPGFVSNSSPGPKGHTDLATLAFDLGYSDQSHFTNDFRSMTGRTPGEYARTNR
ncbi:MAG TPA: AraC family transcriptional regulator [Spirochaetia bacterium]|nr:AraC family transcriptional regulator [Spirochaetia bacterium]